MREHALWIVAPNPTYPGAQDLAAPLAGRGGMRSKGGASITSTLEARAETGRHYNAVVEFRRQSRACFPALAPRSHRQEEH
jgi:hypothetical protein